MAPSQRDAAPAATTIWPIAFAVGVTLLGAGLVLSLAVIAPLGGAIAVLAGFGWVRGWRTVPRLATAPAREARPDAVDAERFARSRFLEAATLGLGGLVALGVALPAAGFSVLPAFLGQRRRPVDLGPISAFPEGQFVVATFLSDPPTGEVSRRAAYVRNNGVVGDRPSFTIMSSRCTHVGCPTQPNGPLFLNRQRFERTGAGEVGLVPTLPAGGFGCPCHGSQFDTEGNRTAGPAPRALDRYRFSIRNGRLVLGDLYSVSRVEGTGAAARIRSFKLTGAGEPASGPESLLYPLDPSS
jgi:Rieske Fe-S protein